MRRLVPTATAAVVLVIAIFLAATGGAVAGSMITGKQIKDGSVTGKDLKDRSVAAADLAPDAKAAGPAGPAGPPGQTGSPGAAGAATIPGYVIVSDDLVVSANTPADLTVPCPAGTLVLGISAFWLSSSAAVQSVVNFNGLSGVGYTNGIPTADILRVRLVCATASLP
jgi:hypothetical protein